MVLRLVGLIIYTFGFVVLRGYLRKHPPLAKGKFVTPHLHLFYALFWMWGVLLWFMPGLLWIGILPVPVRVIVRLSFFIPFVIFMTFLLAVSAFPVTVASRKEIKDLLKKLVFPGFITFMAALFSLQAVFQAFQELHDSVFSPVYLLFFLAFLAIPPAMAILGVVSAVPELVPLDDAQEYRWLMALKILVGFYTAFPKPAWVVEDGKAETRIKGNQFFGFGPGWLMTEPENVVVLQGGTDIKRVVGPGVVLTEFAESPYQVVDLRNQIRVIKVDAVTRDGIEVKLPISSLFRINRGYKTLDLDSVSRHEPWPYRNQRDVFQTVFAEEVDPAGKTPLEAHQARSWDEIPLKVAMRQLKQIVPLFSLDQLYQMDPDANTLTRLVIGKTVRETVEETVAPLGFEILGGAVGNKIVPKSDEVAKQQVEVWKARWIDKVLEWQAEVQVKRLQAFTNVRSDARVNLLSELLEKTQEDFREGAAASDYVAYHLLENLLHIARSAQIKEELPESTIPTLMHLRQLTQEEE